MVYKTVHDAFMNHNQVLANTIGNVMKEVFFRAPVDLVGPSYFNSFDPSAMGTSVPGSCQRPNDGQFKQAPTQKLQGGQAQDFQAQLTAGGKAKSCQQQGVKIKPYQWQGSNVR